ncbi:hypothetical protein [Sinosporangium album]|nr:hypothetical protein [Sinosporangium album]
MTQELSTAASGIGDMLARLDVEQVDERHSSWIGSRPHVAAHAAAASVQRSALDIARLSGPPTPPIAKNDHVWSIAIGMLDAEPLAVVGREKGTVQFWNPVTGQPRSEPLAGRDQPVYSVALTGLIAVSSSVDGTLRTWDLTTDPPTSNRLGASRHTS